MFTIREQWNAFVSAVSCLHPMQKYVVRRGRTVSSTPISFRFHRQWILQGQNRNVLEKKQFDHKRTDVSAKY